MLKNIGLCFIAAGFVFGLHPDCRGMPLEIDQETIKMSVRQSFDIKDDVLIKFSDTIYRPVSLYEVRQAYKISGLQKITYRPERFDCDDFAISMLSAMYKWCQSEKINSTPAIGMATVRTKSGLHFLNHGFSR